MNWPFSGDPIASGHRCHGQYYVVIARLWGFLVQRAQLPEPTVPWVRVVVHVGLPRD